MEGKDRTGASNIQNEQHVPASHEEQKTEWVIQVQQRFRSDKYKNRKSSANVCIFKVPRSIRDFGQKAYKAYVLPLGPFSHSQNKKDLSAVDDHKLRAVESTLQRLNVEGIQSLIDIVKKWDKDIRGCYQDRAVECSDETLAWIMTMGACSIIEFFHSGAEQDFNLIFGLRDVDTLYDILKLENQIPLLVLKRILALYRNDDALTLFALRLSKEKRFRCFPFSESGQEIERKIKRYINNGDANHLLDLCRMLIAHFLLGSSSKSCNASTSASPSKSSYASACEAMYTNEMDESPSFLSAEKLSQAGIKFKKSDDGEIRFKTTCWGSATLSLPPITVDDSTETFLRNLMALEECQKCVRPADTRIISYYICSLDDLINSKEDVALLTEGNIIENLMGSDEEVAHMFNALCNGITVQEYSPYDEIKRRVKEHHNNSKYRWIAEFKERYFSKPWLLPPLAVGGLVSVLTLVQMVTTLFQSSSI